MNALGITNPVLLQIQMLNEQVYKVLEMIRPESAESDIDLPVLPISIPLSTQSTQSEHETTAQNMQQSFDDQANADLQQTIQLPISISSINKLGLQEPKPEQMEADILQKYKMLVDKNRTFLFQIMFGSVSPDMIATDEDTTHFLRYLFLVAFNFFKIPTVFLRDPELLTAYVENAYERYQFENKAKSFFKFIENGFAKPPEMVDIELPTTEKMYKFTFCGEPTDYDDETKALQMVVTIPWSIDGNTYFIATKNVMTDFLDAKTGKWKDDWFDIFKRKLEDSEEVKTAIFQSFFYYILEHNSERNKLLLTTVYPLTLFKNNLIDYLKGPIESKSERCSDQLLFGLKSSIKLD